MEKHPNHVDRFVRNARARFPGQHDEFHHYYQIVCRCQAERFRILISDRDSVKARCLLCARQVILYDLEHYPAASKISGPEEFQEVTSNEGDRLRVFVRYEYGEVDEGEPFDRNDITWCQVWLEREEGKLVRIFDDETA